MAELLGEIELNRIYQRDCIEGMRMIPDESVDLVATDPPYVNVVGEDWDKENVFTDELVSEMRRVLKPSGSIYVWCGIGEKSRSLVDFIQILDKQLNFKDLITWKKQRGIGMRKGWLYTREECLWYVKDNKKFIWRRDNQYNKEDKRAFSLPNNKSDYKRWTNIWTDVKEVAGGMKSAQYHPTQKPVELMERIINLHTYENEVVLDCFMGSGTTAVAALRTNRNFVGFELEPEYVQIANQRLESLADTEAERKLTEEDE
ncbi:DNA-methyltransferase [Salibacterium salarium]|nr:site-specific DNA-methyltransferase [Salibacterium salarium]